MKMPSKVFSAVSSIAVTHLQPTTKDNEQKLTAHPMDLRKLVYQLRLKIYVNVTRTVLTQICLDNAADTKVPSNPINFCFFLQKLPQTTYNIICTRSLIKLIPI